MPISGSLHSDTASDKITVAPDIARQAAEWLVELQSESVSQELRLEWQAWRNADPQHDLAWQRIEMFHLKLKSLPPALAHSTITSTAGLTRRQALRSIAFFAAGTGALWAAKDSDTLRETTADFRTGVGESRTLTLADGTQVAMNTASVINVLYTSEHRLVELLKGEILIATAQDLIAPGQAQVRPFFVKSEQGMVQALGTRFLLRQEEGASLVSVLEGAVALHPDIAVADNKVIHTGEQVRFGQVTVGEVQPVSENISAWLDGMIVASGVRLADFLADLSRYRHGYISCDPAIADLLVSGTYPIADTDRILAALATTLPVKVDQVTRFWVKLKPQASA